MNALVSSYYTIHGAIFPRLQHLDGLAPLAMRLYLFPVLWMAGTHKIAGMESTIEWFGNPDWGLGLPAPWLLAHLAAYTEVKSVADVDPLTKIWNKGVLSFRLGEVVFEGEDLFGAGYIPADDDLPQVGHPGQLLDDPLQRRLIKEHLEREGFLVFDVATGAEALSTLRTYPVDVAERELRIKIS